MFASRRESQIRRNKAYQSDSQLFVWNIRLIDEGGDV